METFDPTKHICKFGFEFNDNRISTYPFKLNVTCDLYLKEIVFEIKSQTADSIADSVGYRLTEKDIETLLDLIRVDDYEKYRDLPYGWEYECMSGYHEFAWYKFWYLSENGYPLYQKNISVSFSQDKAPPFEKLKDWIKKRYGRRQELISKIDLYW